MSKKWAFYIVFLLTALIATIRLADWQLFDDTVDRLALRNMKRSTTIIPARGLILDRNGEVLVYNKASYDLLVSRREVKSFDTLRLCRILRVNEQYVREKFRENRRKRSFVLRPLVAAETYARLLEVLDNYPGFYVQTRTIRDYKDSLACHVLGYLGEVSSTNIKHDEYYRSGDFIGQSGVENRYEKRLRGMKGVKHEVVNALGEVQGAFNNGEEDVRAQVGDDLLMTIDKDLQAYAEHLLKNKRGSIVAIEPETGEVLVLASSPSFPLEDLVGHSRSKSIDRLFKDPLKPLTNRAISGLYSPGSTLKPGFALIGLQEGVIGKYTTFICEGKNTSPIKCTHYHGTQINLRKAMENSCNPYFWHVFKATVEKNRDGYRISNGYERWCNYMSEFGFGNHLGIDLPFERGGNVPQAAFYDDLYKKWIALTIRSLSIGQGEIQVTPLQLANFMAIIANRGHYIQPHVVRDDVGFFQRFATSIEKRHYETVIESMRAVYEGSQGTARYYKNPRLPMAGKTGTVENHGEDHSLFIGFAPIDNPKIAICAIVENAGFGSVWSAPMCTLLMERYILGAISEKNRGVEEKIITSNLLVDESEE